MSDQEEPARRLPRLPRIPDALWLIALIVLGSWGLWNFQWIADDLLVIRNYTAIDGDDNLSTRWGQVAADFVGPWSGNPWILLYRPLPSLSLAIDFWLFGLNPAVTAYGNLFVHCCSVFLIWRLGKRLLPDPRSALIAAMLFAATPLAHENLAWAVARCGINLPLSLAAALVFLRRYEAGLKGWSLHWPVVSLLVAALMSYEQALFWTLFPGVALVLGAIFMRYEIEERGWSLVALFAPHVTLIPLYLGMRMVILGTLSGGREGQLLPGGPMEALMAPLDRLVESLIPLDGSVIPEQGRGRTYWRWLCLLPVVMGMMAPLHLVDPRSRRYRRALYLLLGFWLLTRVPNLSMELRPGLDWSRTAYYSYPALALLLGLLLATTRYSRWLSFALAIAFAFNLQHRVETRCAWGDAGVQARDLLYQHARTRHALTGAGNARLCYLSRVDGIAGAPAYQPGDMAFALYPPLVPDQVRGLSLHELIRQSEVFAAAAIADAAGGLVAIDLADALVPEPRLSTQDITPFLEDKPDAGLDMKWLDDPEAPSVSFSLSWREDPELVATKPVLILVAGPMNVVDTLSVPDEDEEATARLSQMQAASLASWRLRAPPGAQIALLLELRKDPRDPRSCLARSRVVFATLD